MKTFFQCHYECAQSSVSVFLFRFHSLFPLALQSASIHQVSSDTGHNILITSETILFCVTKIRYFICRLNRTISIEQLCYTIVFTRASFNSFRCRCQYLYPKLSSLVVAQDNATVRSSNGKEAETPSLSLYPDPRWLI